MYFKTDWDYILYLKLYTVNVKEIKFNTTLHLNKRDGTIHLLHIKNTVKYLIKIKFCRIMLLFGGKDKKKSMESIFS